VLAYLTGTLGVTDSQKDGWYRYWCDVGFEALETRLSREAATGTFCHGDAPRSPTSASSRSLRTPAASTSISRRTRRCFASRPACPSHAAATRCRECGRPLRDQPDAE
jgi:hypothetical protein